MAAARADCAVLGSATGEEVAAALPPLNPSSAPATTRTAAAGSHERRPLTAAAKRCQTIA
ncbi:hypothetical protein C1Y40_05510 [Mycobacterium talmoniae]|uniref:Uncharacterized protein n=1 Tax=Mycobacterium talmoniae TaxID=1858794 RepID=A0A2S8BCF4_9MYCO|nr:hypothetical protein C1Y40_05510 [Mycobacterium talmoniae]